MMDESEQVARAYNQYPQREWQRLERDAYHTLEYIVTWHMLERYLPPHGRVLDAGGGPGRYTLELCRRGYQTVLADISPGSLALARQQFDAEPPAVQACLQEMVVVDVRDLGRFQGDSFDAVLCLGGVITHLSAEEDRRQALTELVRVTRPQGLVCIGTIGFLALLRYGLAYHPHEFFSPDFPALLKTGDAVGPTGSTWHFFRAAETRRLCETHGMETLVMAGCEGLSTGLKEATNALQANETAWQRWLQVLLDTCTEPAVVDMAEHILYIGRKPAR